MVSSTFANFSHKHIGFKPDDFIHSAEKIASSAGIIADRVNEMKVIEMTPDERNVFAQTALGFVYGAESKTREELENAIIESPIQPDQLLHERRYDDKGKDLWTLFNLVQENVVRGGLKGRKRNSAGKMRNVTTRPVKALDRNIKLNQALWFLTEKMAELKQQDTPIVVNG